MKDCYDILVCGAGMAGIAAAVAAAEQDLSVGMVEYFGDPGGIPVSGRLGSISGFSSNGVTAVAGFAGKLVDYLGKMGKACVQNAGSNINLPPAVLTEALWDLLDFYHIDLECYCRVTGVKKEGVHIKSATVSAKEGEREVKAKLFIDATGDADVAALAGCPFVVGRPSDGKVQAATLIFIIGGIDLARIPEYMEVRKIWKSKPRSTVPIDHTVFQFVPHSPDSNEIAVNMTHAINADPLSSRGLTAIRKECIRQAQYLLHFFQTEIPGFEKSWISQYAPQVGVRDSRRIVGDYTLTVEDVLSGHRFADEIALGIWGIDIHNPDGVHHGVGKYIHQPYGISYRCITPKNIANLLVAGRPISCDFEAFSSSRINATCMAVGEAAGAFAPEIIAAGDIRSIDAAHLKNKIETLQYRFFG